MGDTLAGQEKLYLALSGAIATNLAVLPEHMVRHFLANKDQIPGALERGFVLLEKFGLLVDLGIITVPEDYEHASALEKFRKAHGKKFYYFDGAPKDENFPNPSRVLKPGDKLAVNVFRQVVPGTTTSEERMAFLAKQGAVYTGAQGASLVFKEKRNQLPKGYWYSSFDEKERLWRDAEGYHRVPNVNAHRDGGFTFDLGYFEEVWQDHCAFFCFSDVE